MSLKTPVSDFVRDAGLRQPYVEMAIPAFSNKWKIDELSNGNQNIYENEWKFKLNFLLPLGEAAQYGNLKFGAKLSLKEKDRNILSYDYTDSYNDKWADYVVLQVRDGFMPGIQYPIGTPFIDTEYIGKMDFSTLTGKPINEDAAGNYHARENVAAGYLRYDIQLGQHSSLMAGLRVENTHMEYSSFNWIFDEKKGIDRLDPTGKKTNDYTHLLPSILYKLDLSERIKLRASYTKTLARPKYSFLIPSVSYNVTDEEAHIGNPMLKPTTSNNFDLGGEYYFKSIGLVSFGIFYKDLHNVIVEEQWKGATPEIPATSVADYKIARPINAYNASIFGVEMAYERDFGFLSPALKCLGFYGIYTFTTSNTRDYAFEHRVVAPGEEVKMQGTPQHTANASLYFEKKGWNARLSYNFASEFIDEFGASPQLDRYYDKVNYLDFNLSYTFGQRTKTTFFVDATNLLNQPLRYYQGEKNRTMQVEYYGLRLNAGVKLNF